MTRSFRKIARQIRHLPGLEKLDFIWDAIRGPYEALIDRGGKGVVVEIGGRAPVRVPIRYAKGGWENYETKTIEVFNDWCLRHPEAVILDVGSSSGIFTAAALGAHAKNEVIAFDSDAKSLNILLDFCRLVAGNRLRVIRGLITASPQQRADLKAAAAETQKHLRGTAGPDEQIEYICLGEKSAAGIPEYSLDHLLAGFEMGDRPLMVKVDVEGAELLVLQGARQLLRRHRPTLLLEVHADFLPRHGQSQKDLESFLTEEGYDHKLITVDYQQHWICLPKENHGAR